MDEYYDKYYTLYMESSLHPEWGGGGGALASKVVFEIHFKQFWGGQTGCYIFLKASL